MWLVSPVRGERALGWRTLVAGIVATAYAPEMAKRVRLQTRRPSVPTVGDRVASEELGTSVTITAVQGEVDVPVPGRAPRGWFVSIREDDNAWEIWPTPTASDAKFRGRRLQG